MKPYDHILDMHRYVYWEKQSQDFFLIFHSKLVLYTTKDSSSQLELSSFYFIMITRYLCLLVHSYLSLCFTNLVLATDPTEFFLPALLKHTDFLME